MTEEKRIAVEAILGPVTDEQWVGLIAVEAILGPVTDEQWTKLANIRGLIPTTGVDATQGENT